MVNLCISVPVKASLLPWAPRMYGVAVGAQDGEFAVTPPGAPVLEAEAPKELDDFFDAAHG
jgi:hypothetical protein